MRGGGRLPDTLALDDGVAAVWVDARLERVVAEVPGGVAARITRTPDGAHEERLAALELGGA